MKKILILFASCILAACNSKERIASYSVIPLPQEISLSENQPFRLDEKIAVAYPKNNQLLKRNAEFLSEYINQSTGYTLELIPLSEGEEVGNAITLALNPEIENKEGYRLNISKHAIRVEGKTEKGVFYGIQTLRKSIPAFAQDDIVLLPAGVVIDEPRFGYRGMHLDICRHFFSLEFVKRYIDLLALHNMNTFHWHLTEDQGWRIEIKKYPKLTEVGAYRNRTVVGHLGSGKYDKTRSGGYYTQEEMKEVVEYARERYIDVIPEVDIPGHMLAALAAYPELGCTGGPYEVAADWGVFDDVLCIGNDKTIQFLEDVMTELIEIFPSKYIHVGGDEVPRTRWRDCPKCQARIRTERLKADSEHSAEDRLQSYCMRHIEKFLNERGRQIIGWDEILEGDVAPNATVMSWRGADGGIKAARMGHDVIMTPNAYCYFDYYQTGDTKDEPLAIGGCIPLEKVYSLNPTESLTEEQAKHILGVQANLWTEYISSTEYVEYMVLPRMAALAEVQWTQPKRKSYNNFISRITNLLALYQRNGLNYCKHIFNIRANYVPNIKKKELTVTLSTIDSAPIYYTLDGSTPTKNSLKYESPIHFDQTVDFRAVAIRNNINGKPIEKQISFNKATLASIVLTPQPVPNYTFGGASTLVDGMTGNDDFTTGAWLGFLGKDVTAVIDLGQQTKIKQVSVNAMTYMDAWIMGIIGLQVSLSSDNETFKEVACKEFPMETNAQKRSIEIYKADFEPMVTRYVKVTIIGSNALPKEHIGVGQMPYLFIDEITVE